MLTTWAFSQNYIPAIEANTRQAGPKLKDASVKYFRVRFEDLFEIGSSIPRHPRDKCLRLGPEKMVSVATFLVEFMPAAEPRDGRKLTEQDFIGSLEQQGLEARPAHWQSVGSYIGGRGGGFEQIAHIFIGAAAGGFALGVTKSFADALGKDLYEQFKRCVRRIAKGSEDQIRRARMEATFELPSGQWLFFWLDAKDLYKNLDKLGKTKVQIGGDQPRVWFVYLEKRRFLFFERTWWTITPYPLGDQQPPSLPD